MKKLTGIIIFISFLTMMISSIIARIIYLIIVGNNFHESITEEKILFLGITSLTLSVLLFSFAISFFIVRRVKSIDKAILKVINGNYDFTLDTKGHDEIANLSKNFNVMINELKSNEYLNKEFVRNFSHEFKTPLSVIKGYAELIDSNGLTKEERKRYLAIIVSESERLSNLANNMLQISLIDSTSIITKEDEYNLSEQIRNIIKMTQMKWEKKKLTFDLNMDEIEIRSNKELTYQIILNLLSNAIKFSYESEKIKITLKETNELIKLSITNKGQPIPDEDFEKVFQLFYIVDKSKNGNSTGIGLTLTKKIVNKLKGEISFKSMNGLTTFNVELYK